MTSWISGWRIAAIAATCALAAACGQNPPQQAEATNATAPAAAEGKEYQVGWTIYAGWMPWPYAEQAGIVKKWADKYGVKIKVVQINDYAESLNQFFKSAISPVDNFSGL